MGATALDSDRPLFCEYGWRAAPGSPPIKIKIVDETYRDGFQGSNVKLRPTVEERKILIRLAYALGVRDINIGLPVNANAIRECIELAIYAKELGMRPHVACRTVISDIEGALQVARGAGIPDLEVCAFHGGTALVRRIVENWTMEKVARDVEGAIAFGVRSGLRMTLVLEDMSRTHMEDMAPIILLGMRTGATRLVVTDTVGAISPDGVPDLLGRLRNLLDSNGFPNVAMDWHGHNDLGMAVANALAAALTGLCDRIHCTVLGIGERAGNPDMAQVLLNLYRKGLYPREYLKGVREYTLYGSEITGVPIPENHPVNGLWVLSTATGVHSAAVVHGLKLGDKKFAGLVYLPYDPEDIGRKLEIRLGYMSGKSNAAWVLDLLGFRYTDADLSAALAHAQGHKHAVLSDDEVRAWALSSGLAAA